MTYYNMYLRVNKVNVLQCDNRDNSSDNDLRIEGCRIHVLVCSILEVMLCYCSLGNMI
jgi:hypothetical protein